MSKTAKAMRARLLAQLAAKLVAGDLAGEGSESYRYFSGGELVGLVAVADAADLLRAAEDYVEDQNT